MTLIWLLQLAIAPIMVLWLGSLYQTRYRESLLIESAKTVSEIFPHVINAYPSIHPITQYPLSRKRFRILQYFPHINSFLYTWWRVFLVAVFVAPSVMKVQWLHGIPEEIESKLHLLTEATIGKEQVVYKYRIYDEDPRFSLWLFEFYGVHWASGHISPDTL